MSTAVSSSQMTDLELLHHFLGICLREGGRARPSDEVLAEFREYREEVERLREEIRPALEASLRVESKPIDWVALKDRVTRELAEREVVD